MSVTIKDVAQKAGVSFATVSRVLRGERYVSAETQQAVHRAVKELGYHPNSLARNFKTKRSNIIGFVMPDISNPFFATIARGIEERARRNGYDLIIYDTHSDPDRELKGLQMLAERRVDGVILSPISDQLLKLEIPDVRILPVVLVDNLVEGAEVDSVIIDNVQATRRLVEHLLSLGHRKIAMITGPLNQTTGKDRLAGYLSALHDHGIPEVKGWIREGDFLMQSGYELAGELLDKADKPTAILAANNFMALGAMRAIRERGLHIPRDMALVAFDDMSEFTTLLDPPLTAMVQPAGRLGDAACDLLLRRLHAKRSMKPRQVIMEAELLIRGSCGANAYHD
ncbi:MAG: LacI family DNA-binding transcriptional regulator [Firmicutes bacterium]|nr:LacI family DNA-binding transcriptional regulator [Bacillota bacterium]